MGKRTKILELRINVRGDGYQLSISVPEHIVSGVHSTDYERRARAYAAIAVQVKSRLERDYGLDKSEYFLSETDITIVDIRYRKKDGLEEQVPAEEMKFDIPFQPELPF